MTNVFKTPEKKWRRARLFQIGLETLHAQGWTVERTQGGASVRLIRRTGESRQISIKTTQDRWLAFQRRKDKKGWVTLSKVDVVLVVSLDDGTNPPSARVHWIEADDMRARFDHAYVARQEADHVLHGGRGVWIPLYIADDGTPGHAGGGAGLDHPEIARVPLVVGGAEPHAHEASRPSASPTGGNGSGDKPLSIAEAKRRLALTFGVPETSIKISIDA